MNVHPLHGMKRMIAGQTKSRKMRQDGGAEFHEKKASLENVKKQMQMYKDATDATHSAWLSLVRTQRELFNKFEATYPHNDAVRASVSQYASNLSALQAATLGNENITELWRGLHSIVERYVAELDAIDYKTTERAYAEFARYTSKCERLSGKKKRDDARVARNYEKRDHCRLEFDTILHDVTARMDDALYKYPAVFQCAIVAFWLRNRKSLGFYAGITSHMHNESSLVAETLLRVDLGRPETYERFLPPKDSLFHLPPSSTTYRKALPEPQSSRGVADDSPSQT